MRIGHGYDVHRFGEGDHITLGGVRIPHRFGLLAHSDGDVLLHALSDALLGAAALGDIGKHFPDTDPQFKGADSRALLRHVLAQVQAKVCAALQPLDDGVVAERFAALAREIGAATGQPQTPRHVAEGFLRVAVANMANAIKQVSIQKGQDATRFALQCFGGAGGQHACLVADELGMETVFIHPFAGVLSAYGMGLADQSAIREGAVEAPLAAEGMADLEARLDALAEAGREELLRQGADPVRISAARRLHLRYAGTDTFLPVPFGPHGEVLEAFTAAHRQRFLAEQGYAYRLVDAADL